MGGLLLLDQSGSIELTIGLAAALMAALIGMILLSAGLNAMSAEHRKRGGARRPAGGPRAASPRHASTASSAASSRASQARSTSIPCWCGWASSSSRSLTAGAAVAAYVLAWIAIPTEGADEPAAAGRG